VTAGRARDPLTSYRSKRDFSRTPEPAGALGGGAPAQPRFVIHEHSARRMHWDLRLERDGVLVSWAIPKGMPEEPGRNHIAPHTEDHPLDYLDFDGEIPAGSYGAGTMRIWDHGTYECLKWEPRKVEVALHGERLDARYALFAIGAGDGGKDWMIHRMDAPADAEREPMPQQIVPMLARAGALPRDQLQWAFEIKWDGVRAIAYGEPGLLRFESRNGLEITASYPELGRLGRALGSHRAVLDGEIVAFDADGHPSFEALAPRMHVASPARAKRLAESTPVTYVIFDLLWLDGHSLMASSYAARRRSLAELALSGEHWRTPEHIVGQGRATLEASRKAGLEGIVAKRLDSRYAPGRRTGDWIKLKNLRRERVIIGGWMRGAGRRGRQVGALLMGQRDEAGALRYAGRVGTGFSERDLDRLTQLLEPLERAASPFSSDGPAPPRGALFCEPRLAAEVEFRERTKAGLLRQPSFKALLDDPAERPAGNPRGAAAPARPRAADRSEVALSNLDKVLYPVTGFTKREVIDYYAAIAPVLLPHLHARPLTVTRYPDGVDGKAFFQKQSPAHRPDWVATVAVASERRKQIDFTLVEDTRTLVWLANLAALELHVPMARAPALERPTAVVFDLDPGPPATIVECCQVGLWLQGMFERLGLASFAKTSGSKGLQVYVPLNSAATHAETKSFARNVATLLERTEPAIAVSRMTKALRAGKVLIDWSQNDEHKTTICVYSLRARERPTVSTPVEWDEVRATLRSADAARLAFDSSSVLERVSERGDLFAPVLSLVQTLPAF
jgi:bifunctional non-homologous end joining protein LigD